MEEQSLGSALFTTGTQISSLNWLTVLLPAPSVSLHFLSGLQASPSWWTQETHLAHYSWVMCSSSFLLCLGHHLGWLSHCLLQPLKLDYRRRENIGLSGAGSPVQDISAISFSLFFFQFTYFWSSSHWVNAGNRIHSRILPLERNEPSVFPAPIKPSLQTWPSRLVMDSSLLGLFYLTGCPDNQNHHAPNQSTKTTCFLHFFRSLFPLQHFILCISGQGWR